MIWELSHRFESRALALANRHYNRQKPESPQFVPPGRNIVLYAETLDGRAMWVSSWPLAEYTRHDWAGAWVCTAFRNEGAALSSDLIRSAIAVTRWHWGDAPALGMVTFVDAAKVRHKRDPGRCFTRAGFTRARALVALRLLPEHMPAPEAPIGSQARLFA